MRTSFLIKPTLENYCTICIFVTAAFLEETAEMLSSVVPNLCQATVSYKLKSEEKTSLASLFRVPRHAKQHL